MSLATITLDRSETFEMKRTVTGETILTVSQDVIRKAYCDMVNAELMRARGLSQPQSGEKYLG